MLEVYPGCFQTVPSFSTGSKICSKTKNCLPVLSNYICMFVSSDHSVPGSEFGGYIRKQRACGLEVATGNFSLLEGRLGQQIYWIGSDEVFKVKQQR
jgi:hypothetical protein